MNLTPREKDKLLPSHIQLMQYNGYCNYAMYYIKSCDTDRTFVAAAHAQYSLLLSIFEVFTCA